MEYMEWVDKKEGSRTRIVKLPTETKSQTSNDQRFKADGGKSRPTLLERDFVDALRAVQATLDYGAQKYEARSWKGVSSERYDDAARRHRIAIDLGELRDRESGLLHRAHQIVCELMILQSEIDQLKQANPDFDYVMFNKPPQDHKT